MLVTASVDDLQFLHPIKVGDMIILRAWVNAAFRTSIEVEVEVFSEEALTGRRQDDQPRVPDVRRRWNRQAAACGVPPLLLETEESERPRAAPHGSVAKSELKRKRQRADGGGSPCRAARIDAAAGAAISGKNPSSSD